MESTSDERRQVAERLRITKAECESRDYPWMVEDLLQAIGFERYEDGEDGIFDRLADLIDRPTCRNISGYQDVFECSECRCRVELITEVCNEHGEPFSVSLMPSFCPNCGAVVMDNE